MDGSLRNLGFDIRKRRARWILAALVLGFSGYGVYTVYNLPSVARKRRRLLRIVGALISLAEAVSESAETVSLVSRDLREFLESDSDKIPNSCSQILKIGDSTEVSESIICVTRALTVGVVRGYYSASKDVEVENGSRFEDRVLDKLFTQVGSGFASVVVGSFARNLVMAFFSKKSDSDSKMQDSDETDRFNEEKSSVPDWLYVLHGKEVSDLVGDWIQKFVGTAVAVYLDKTLNVNTYDEIFAGLTNPKHEKKVGDLLASICNGAVATLVRTSHQVMAGQDMNDGSSFGSSHLAMEGTKGLKAYGPDWKGGIHGKPRNSYGYANKNSGWVSKVSSTLAIPSNRRLVVDLTGRVTFETVRSLLEFLTERAYDGMKQSVDAVHDAVIDKGFEVVRFVTAKSSVVTTICLSLCLHMLDGASLVSPA